MVNFMLCEFHLSKNITLKEILKKNEVDIHMVIWRDLEEYGLIPVMEIELICKY